MKKLILIAVLLLTTSQTTFAQTSLAKIKFNEAEEAYVKNDFDGTIKKLNEVENLLKSTNPKVMYLRIMAQSKIIEKNPLNDFKIIVYNRTLCAKYLKNYENVPDNEDKYNDIYKTSETLKSYPANEVEFNSEKQSKAIKNEIDFNKKIKYLNSNLLDLEKHPVNFESVLEKHKGVNMIFLICSTGYADFRNNDIIKNLQENHKDVDFVFIYNSVYLNPFEATINIIKDFEYKGDKYIYFKNDLEFTKELNLGHFYFSQSFVIDKKGKTASDMISIEDFKKIDAILKNLN